MLFLRPNNVGKTTSAKAFLALVGREEKGLVRQLTPAEAALKCALSTVPFVFDDPDNLGEVKARLTKMHAKALTCFNFFNFHPLSTKFPINIEHVILTNRMFFVFRIATFLAGK
jgi:hypothetical protein